MNLNLQLGKFIEAIEEYKDVRLEHNKELDISNLGIYVPTPGGSSKIQCVIKKENLEGISILLENDVEIKCARKHILIQNGFDIYAELLQVGDTIDTIDGNVIVQRIIPISDTTYYDIGIDAPHLYYDPNGILHHNTITTATLSHLCEQYGRTIIIVPNKSLVEQTEEDYINCGLDVGVYYGGRKDLNKTHTICTWQSLNVLDKKNKNFGEESLPLAEFLEGVSAVIVDECHMADATVLHKLLTQNLKNAPIRWGLTGTVPKLPYQFECIYASLGPVVGRLAAHELQEMGVLSNCHINITQLLDIPAFATYAEETKYLVTNKPRMTYISRMINEIAKSGNTLVLVNRIDSGKFLVEHLDDAVFISGTVKTKDRKSEYDEVKTSDNKTIVATYGVAAVGINIVRINNLILLEPGKSFTRVIQSIGRGLRKGVDKDHVDIYDITSTCKFSKRHLTERKKFYNESKYPFTITKVDWN